LISIFTSAQSEYCAKAVVAKEQKSVTKQTQKCNSLCAAGLDMPQEVSVALSAALQVAESTRLSQWSSENQSLLKSILPPSGNRRIFGVFNYDQITEQSIKGQCIESQFSSAINADC
jgi:nucleoid-associated protein YejK